MTGFVLPLTKDPWQIMTMDLTIDNVPFHAQVEVRYLSAPDIWVLSIRDHSNSQLLVNMIPLVCSYGVVNDLLAPFRYLRDGIGLGSLIVLRSRDEPSTPDPTGSNLDQFQVVWSDTYVESDQES